MAEKRIKTASLTEYRIEKVSRLVGANNIFAVDEVELQLPINYSIGRNKPVDETGYMLASLENLIHGDVLLPALEARLKESEHYQNSFYTKKIDTFIEYPNMYALSTTIKKMFTQQDYKQWIGLLQSIASDNENIVYRIYFHDKQSKYKFRSKQEALEVLKFLIAETEECKNPRDFPISLDHIEEEAVTKKLRKFYYHTRSTALDDELEELLSEEMLTLDRDFTRISRELVVPKKVLLQQLAANKQTWDEEAKLRTINIFDFLNEKKHSGRLSALDHAEPDREKMQFLPDSNPPLGASAGNAWLLQHLANDESEIPHFLFLVGASGNGKSNQLIKLEKKLRGIGFNKGQEHGNYGHHKVYRNYKYVKRGKVLNIIGDATATGDLTEDIRNALDQKKNLFININRGILAEEIARFQNSEKDKISELIDWLIEPEKFRDSEVILVNKLDGKNNDYFLSASLCEDQGVVLAKVILVQMDYASLLEKSPEAISWENDVPNVGDYTISRMRDGDCPERAETAAGQYVKGVVDRINQIVQDTDDETHRLFADEDSPYHANLKFFSNPQALNGFLNLVRCSEINSGHRFSYRNLISLVVVALIGHDLSERQEKRSQREKKWYDNKNFKNIRHLIALAYKRTHMGLFYSTAEVQPFKIWRNLKIKVNATDPALKDISIIDPAKASSSRWAREVRESLKFMQSNRKPSDELKRDHPIFKQIWTKFDEKLENGILVEINSGKDSIFGENEQKKLINWYGRYLFRLFGFAHGQANYLNQVAQWTDVWTAAYQGQALNDAIRKGLLTLIFNHEERVYLPILSSSAVPISKDKNLGELQLAAKFSLRNLRFKPIVKGEKVSIEVSSVVDPGDPLLSLPFNLDLSRDLRVSLDGQMGGFTDTTRNLIPRLERLRSIMMSEKYQKLPDENPEFGYFDTQFHNY